MITTFKKWSLLQRMAESRVSRKVYLPDTLTKIFVPTDINVQYFL